MNIGFISTRLAGTDGVSLETFKLATVLKKMNHQCFYCAGELDPTLPGLVAPELHFTDPVARTLSRRAFHAHPDATLLDDIAHRARQLEEPIRRFLYQYDIHYLIIQNVFAIPMQLPLALALTNILRETGLPALAHNHDFYWERERFLTNNIPDFLDTYFPPDLPNLQHATINSLAQAALKKRRGLDSILIPNVFDFDTPPPGIDAENADFRAEIGLTQEDLLILQPTRVIPRKRIELAIELLARLDNPRACLVIPHQAGDEGTAYLEQLKAQAQSCGVRLLHVADRIAERRGWDENGRKQYTLWDVYPHANFVTYPSIIEGFGNALIETVYFRLPALVNRYPVYVADIAPLGFDFIEIDNQITDETVNQVQYWLTHPERVQQATTKNYALGRQHFSYQTLHALLEQVISNKF